jgi:tetratricopeptide (TPR) repeat protein
VNRFAFFGYEEVVLKTVPRTLLVILAIVFVCGSAGAQRGGRKLPVSAYLKTAKIEILSGEPERYEYAIAMLDSLFMHYGPHAEGLYLMGQIMVDGIETTPNLEAKGTYLEKMVAYFDSLKMCCDNKKIKKNYKKDCKDFITIADSLRIKYWRQFFNDGIRQLGFAEESQKDLKSVTDSSARSFIEEGLKVNVDSSIENMKLSIVAIADSARPYLIIDKAYGMKGEYQSGIEWLQKGFDKSDDPATIQLSIAYDYIMMNDYCGAIPYYRDYIANTPEDVSTLKNLAICYNNCGMYDSAVAVFNNILTIEPENADVVSSIGRYYNTLARAASDSVLKYQQEDNNEMTKTWIDKKQTAFDSSRVYFRRAFEIKPDISTAEQYGLVCALLGDYEEATIGFKKLTELEPQRVDNWTSLGDCHLSLKQFKEAASAYEKAVELEPDNIRVWEHLIDLYFETKQTAKKAEAEKKLKELKR